MKNSNDKIYAINSNRNLKLFINDILHLEIIWSNHDGLQSWFEGEKKNRMFFIEFYRKEGNAILVEYIDFNRWKTILNIITEHI